MRSLTHLLALADELRERRADLVARQQHTGTATPAGRLAHQVPGAIGELQRELIAEGTREGLGARARGRTPKLNARPSAMVRCATVYGYPRKGG